MHGRIHIPGENQQGKEDLWLTKAEYDRRRIASVEDMIRLICDSIEDEWRLELFECESEWGLVPYALFISDHACVQADKRFGSGKRYELMSHVKKVLRNAVASQFVTGNSILFDPVAGEPIPSKAEGTVQSIVCVEDDSVLLVFEAGDFYIRLKSVWNRDNPNTYHTKGGKVLQLNKDGSYTTNAAQIRRLKA